VLVRHAYIKKNHEQCVFCRIARDLKNLRKQKKLRSRWVMQNKHFFVLLDRHPKVTGHTLIISKRHSDDITQLNVNESRSLSHILVKTAKLLKESLGADKIYTMSMCEHWEAKEIDSRWTEGQKSPNTTEHFHVHLLPRYPEMRTKEVAQENMFTRPQDYGCTLEMLDLVRKRIRKGNL
jgi:histidine triad (HIT) family protein